MQTTHSSCQPLPDPKSRTPKSGFCYSYGVDYITLRWSYLFWIRPGVWDAPPDPLPSDAPGVAAHAGGDEARGSTGGGADWGIGVIP